MNSDLRNNLYSYLQEFLVDDQIYMLDLISNEIYKIDSIHVLQELIQNDLLELITKMKQLDV